MIMEDLLQQTKVLLHEIQQGLSTIERAEFGEAPGLENLVFSRIDQAMGNCERLDVLVRKEPPKFREHAKLQVDQLKYDCRHLQQALQTIQSRRLHREKEEIEREELLKRSFQPNNSDTSILIDRALGHNSSLNNAHQGVDNLLDHGQSILSNLREQRSTLKSAHKKVLDLMNTLGLSNTVMRLIERRTYQDKFILYGGMIVTCIVMFITVKYFFY